MTAALSREERAAEVLAEHQSKPMGSPFCRCGWRPGLSLNDTESDRLQHIWHQAAMLAAAGVLADPDALAKAWDEGALATATNPTDEDYLTRLVLPVNPYRQEPSDD